MSPDDLRSLTAKGYVRGEGGVWSRPDSERRPGAPAVSEVEKLAKACGPKVSPLVRKFEEIWRRLQGPHLTPEHRFMKERKFRFDFAHLVAHVAVELEGGIHSGGRHNRASGFKKDCEKYNFAARDGWILFRLCTGMVTDANVIPIIAVIRRKLSES